MNRHMPDHRLIVKVWTFVTAFVSLCILIKAEAEKEIDIKILRWTAFSRCLVKKKLTRFSLTHAT